MKYIKTYENMDKIQIDLKKYIISIFYNKVIKIFENLYEDDDYVRLKVLYSWEASIDPLLTINLSLPPHREFIISKNKLHTIWFNNVVDQTNSLEDAIETSKFLSNSLKYNL